MGRMHLGALFKGLVLLAIALWVQPFVQAQNPPARQYVPVLTVDGPIGPATADYVTRGIASAMETGAPLILIRMDTPGGLDTSMREIIRAIVNSPVPVATYVSPSGARAASAGAFILTASHIAAMAPGTNVGAATPVQLGAPSAPGPADGTGSREEQKTQSPKGASPSEAKALNDAIAYIRSLAEMRGRNAEWAEAAVREATSLSAQAALNRKVIDLVARDTADLMRQVDGRRLQAGGREVQLDTSAMTLREVTPNWRTRLLSALTNPNIALILMMIGAYGLLFEFMNPGALYPGTIGAIALLLGLYALSALPVNYAGIALILLGLALVVAEAFAPSFGILGIGGAAAFMLGGAILFDTDLPQFRLGWPVLGAVGMAALGATILTARLAIRSRHRKVASGREEMIGSVGLVMDWQGTAGHVRVHGERWRATGDVSLEPEQPVRITALQGLVLEVEPAQAT